MAEPTADPAPKRRFPWAFLIILAGCALIVAGVALVSIPGAVVTAGLLVALLGVDLTR